MARPRKPTALLELNGSLSHNPGRHANRAGEPFDPRPLGDPPLHLDPPQRAAWGEIERIAPPGVLCHGDRLIVELAAVLLAQFRAAGAMFPDGRLRRLESVLGQLGLTPAARSKVTATPVPKGNPFASVGQRPKG
jgi:hypothetical protein